MKRTSSSPASADAIGILLGAALDAVVGDPQRWHPVAGYGRAASLLEQRLYRDSRAAGIAFTAVSVGVPVVLGQTVTAATRRRPALRTLSMAAAVWASLGATTLAREGKRQHELLDAGDIDGSRARLSYLCGRDPSMLDSAALTRATCESIAENTNDATVAPLFWAALGGIPGVLALRAINTNDAMVGHLSARYRSFGWASARLDDFAGWLPARATGLLAAAAAPAVDGQPGGALRSWHADAPAHPSPNAGVCESAFAGALGVSLGGPIEYPYGPSDRPWLNEAGREVETRDITRTVRLARCVTIGAVVGASLISRARARRCAR